MELVNHMIRTFSLNCTFIRMSSSAQCPAARGSGRVTSAAEMPREEWLTNHTAPTCPAPRSRPPASALVANGVPGSGLLWVKTSITVSNQYRCFPLWGLPVIYHIFFSATMLKQNGHLVLLWIVNYWCLHVSMVREPKLMMMSLQKNSGGIV